MNYIKLKGLAASLLCVCLGLFTGCSSNNSANDEEVIKIYTSFYPMYDFASKVGGDKVEVINMVPAGIEPHDYEPSAKDIVALEKADLFVYNGVGMESWVDKVVDTIENEKLVVVEAAHGVELVEGHHHDHEDEEHGEEEHAEEEHAHEHEEEHGEELAYDPHVWMSIENAKQEMNNIKEALVEIDSKNAAYYNANYEKYAAEFDALDAKYESVLGALENKDVIVAHEAFTYLCKDYGLNQVAIEGLSPDSEPEPARMAEIIKFAKEKNIKVIFFEELVSPKVAETLAKEIGAKTDMLNPLEGLTKEQLEAGEDYLSMMEQNLTALEKALQ